MVTAEAQYLRCIFRRPAYSPFDLSPSLAELFEVCLQQVPANWKTAVSNDKEKLSNQSGLLTAPPSQIIPGSSLKGSGCTVTRAELVLSIFTSRDARGSRLKSPIDSLAVKVQRRPPYAPRKGGAGTVTCR
uniref:Uncharacterized protein n=1 Tax=Schistocephalus solidus TaxID=70667 RepID=A0A0X3PIV6_SCHSO